MDYSIYKDNKMVIGNVKKADNFFSRFKGLMFKKMMNRDCGLLISPCNQVHTFNMKFDIDVIFLSKKFEVLYIRPSMKHGKISKMVSNAYYVLELCSGVAAEKEIKTGDILLLKAQEQTIDTSKKNLG